MAKAKAKREKMTLEQLKENLAIKPASMLRTGVLPFDLVFKGHGLPTNGYIVFWSESGFGKTTTLLSVAKSLSTQRKKTVYAMVEDSMKTAEDMGIAEDENIIYINVRSYVEAEQAFDAFINSDADLMILDSVTALSTEEVIQQDEETGDLQPASDARLQSALEKKYANMLKNTGKAMIIVSQERANFNKGWTGPETTMAGGYSLKFYSVCVVQGLGGRGVIDNQTKEVIGTVGYLTVPEKNRFAPPRGRSPIQIIFGKGQSNIYALLCYMQWKGMYTQGGSTFKISYKGKDTSVQGKVGLYNWVKENYDSLVEDFYSESEAYFQAGKEGWKPSDSL